MRPKTHFGVNVSFCFNFALLQPAFPRNTRQITCKTKNASLKSGMGRKTRPKTTGNLTKPVFGLIPVKCEHLAFLLVASCLGCKPVSEKYRFSQNMDRSSERTHEWTFSDSPSFDIRRQEEIRPHIDEALKQLGLPPVPSDAKRIGGLSEGTFHWSFFEWTNYPEGDLLVRVGAEGASPEKTRVRIVGIEKKP